MKISSSIASSDILRIGEEVRFANHYFDDIHLDVADGIAVGEISFGFKMCSRICELAAVPVSLHLEVSNPLQYVEQVKECDFDIVFIQIDCLKNAKEVVRIYQENQIPTGINLSNLDLGREELGELLGMTEHVLINTTCHNDVQQRLRMDMLDYSVRLADETPHKVWVDGAISWEIAHRLRESDIYAAVMGRAIFLDRDKAVENKKNLYQ
ncbi:MAG: hypothetical protein HFH10_03215 [Dorea sp.]|nr:hypothetical protein [Dorea sp.]